jgi:ribosomal protein S21
MSNTVNVEVNIEQTRGDVIKLIRKFMKKCKKERIVEDYLDRRFYKKPSATRRLEKLKKIKNARKAEADRNKSLETTNKKSRRRR